MFICHSGWQPHIARLTHGGLLCVDVLRTANNPMYKAINLHKVDWGSLKGAVTHSYMVFAEEPWFADYR